MLRLLCGTVACLFLSGCMATTETYLYANGKTVSRADTDHFDCKVQAAKNVPADNKLRTTPVHQVPYSTNCTKLGGQILCQRTGGHIFGGHTYSYDANAPLRREFLSRCIARKGYTAQVLPICDSASVPSSLKVDLKGKLRPPKDGACYLPITNYAGNVIYSNELSK